MSGHTALERAAYAAGNWSKLAHRLSVSHQVMHRWRKQGYVPTDRALQIEEYFGIPAREIVDPRFARIFNEESASKPLAGVRKNSADDVSSEAARLPVAYSAVRKLLTTRMLKAVCTTPGCVYCPPSAPVRQIEGSR